MSELHAALQANAALVARIVEAWQALPWFVAGIAVGTVWRNDKPATWLRAALIGAFAGLVCWAIVNSLEVWV
jgi:Mg/Co/Ni transporter MgtE